MRDIDPFNITQEVLSRMANCPNARLKDVVTALVEHLHAFVREVGLTEAEWKQGIDFLTATGHQCEGDRQEFILLSDVLGISMLTVAQAHAKLDGCTEATVLGPFHAQAAPHYDNGDDVGNGAQGIPCVVRGRVKGLDGTPVAGAQVDVWQADAQGLYDVQREGLAGSQGRGVLRTDGDGCFHFRSVVAESYPIPVDGPVGRLLQALGRHPWRPAHMHFLIKAEGHATLVTQVFRQGDPYLDSDAVFGVRKSLVADWVQQADGSFLLDHDFVLAPSP